MMPGCSANVSRNRAAVQSSLDVAQLLSPADGSGVIPACLRLAGVLLLACVGKGAAGMFSCVVLVLLLLLRGLSSCMP